MLIVVGVGVVLGLPNQLMAAEDVTDAITNGCVVVSFGQAVDADV